MKTTLIALVLILLMTTGFAQDQKTPSEKMPTAPSENIFSVWAKLSLSGKNQFEIEDFFRNVGNEKIEDVKKRIRFQVINNLQQQGIRSLVEKSFDMDDFNSIRRKIALEIRYAGLEQDNDLKMTIKEQFGIMVH